MEGFKNLTERINALSRAGSLLNWDMATGAPKGGNPSRAKYIGIIAAEEFSLKISDEMKGYLDEIEKDKSRFDEEITALYRECKKAYDSNKKIPAHEMQKYQELIANAQQLWGEAKGCNDYSKFAPVLDEIIKYNKKFINYRGYNGHPYNTLLDDYEPGMTVEILDKFFEKLKASIVPLLKSVKESKKHIDTSFVNRPVSEDKQKQISEILMKRLGYDLNRGMLKVSEHPFTIGLCRNDVRITTRYHETQFLSSFFSVIHEAGHALYEQNVMEKIEDTLLDTGISMGIHESQSRFYENIIGRSFEFWQSIYNEIIDILGDDFKDVSAVQFYEAANEAKASLIRIEADELTYSLHIMLRYEMEKYMLSEEYDINELPRIWNDKTEEYLGLTPDNNAVGILQDIHWSAGLFGYFPSYSLGSAYAAQLLSYMGKDMDVFKAIKENRINDITRWLAANIHQYGSLKTPSELIRQINGEELNADYYINYLTKKYTKLYEL